MGYKYYDTPEGEDCFPKMLYTTKLGTVVGVGFSLADVILLSHPKGYLQTVGRFAYMTLPFTAMGAAFAAATCLSTSVRKKDDKLNYIVGAFSSGAIFGAWRRSIGMGMLFSVAFAVAGVLKKDSVDNGWTFFQAVEHRQYGSVDRHRHDYTIVQDRPGDWRRSL